MRKFTSALVLMAIIFTSIGSFSTLGAGKLILEEGFSKDLPANITKSADQKVILATDPMNGNEKALQIAKTDTTKTGDASMGQLFVNIPEQKGIFTVEADLFIRSGSMWIVMTSGTAFPYGPGISFTPAISAFDGAEQKGKGSGIISNKWQRVGIEVDPANAKYNIYCNGALQTPTAFGFRNAALGAINNIIFRTPSGTAESDFFLDNIKVYEGACDKASTVTSKSLAQEATPTPAVYTPADESKYIIPQNPVMKDLYVSPNGNDGASGSESAPFKTIEKAVAAVRAINSNMTGDIVVNILPGEYYVESAINLTEQDGGKDKYHVIYKAKKGPLSVRIYGAKALSGWTRDKGDIWKVQVEQTLYTLYENDQRAIKARFPNREFNKEYTTSKAPYLLTNDPDTKAFDKLIYKAEDLKNITFSNYKDANVVVWPWNKCDWQMWVSPIESVDKNTNTIIAQYKESAIPIGLNARYYIEGMYELLDAKGEFYYNSETKTLYYIPLGNDPMTDTTIYAPTTTELFVLQGINAPVKNLIFDGISFEKTNFVKAMKGWFESGVSAYGWKGAITFENNVSEVKIINSRFKNTGLTGVFIKGVSKYNYIANCLFENIGNSGVIMQSGVGEKNMYNKIENVLIHDIGENSIDCAGVNIFTGQGNIVTNVEVYNSPRYAVSVRGGAGSFAWFTRPEDLNNEKYGGRSRYNIIKNSKFYETNQDSGDTGSLHSAGVSFGVEPYNTNYFENLYIDSIYAHPSMKDWAPNGIFNDYQSFGQSYKNIKITNEAGGSYSQAPTTFTDKTQVRMNETDPLAGKYENVSWMDGFDDAKMDYSNLGLTESFPFLPDYEKLKKAVILEEGSATAMKDGKFTSIDPKNPAVMPVNISDRVLVPIRFIAESFGADVTWNEPVATIKLGDKTIELTENQKQIKINGTVKEIDVPAMIINDRTMVPIRAVAESLGKEVVYYNGFISISDKKNLWNEDRDDLTIKRIGAHLLTGYAPKDFKFKQVTTAGLKEYGAKLSVEKPGTGLMIRANAATGAAFVGVVNVPGIGLRLYERTDNYKIPTFTDLGIMDAAQVELLSSGGQLIVKVGGNEVYNKPNALIRPIIGTYGVGSAADITYGSIKLPGGKAEKITLMTTDNVLEKDQKIKLSLKAVDEKGGEHSLLAENPVFKSSNPEAVVVDGNFAVGKGVGKSVISVSIEIDDKTFTAEKELEAVAFNKVLINEPFDKESFVQDAWDFAVTDQTNGSYVKINDDNKLEVNAQAGKLISALRKFNQFTGKVTIEFDFKAEFSKTSKNSGAMLAYFLGDGNTFCVSTFAYEGYFSYFTDGQMNQFGTCESGKEYKIRIDADVTTNTMDVYVNGKKEVTGAKFRNPAKSLGGIQIGCTSNAEDTMLWWDNIKVSKEQ